MGSDNLHLKRSLERQKRTEKIFFQRTNTWLIVCEGEKTEPNYFEELIEKINECFPADKKIRVRIEGKGRNTVSLVKTVEELQNLVDKYKTIIPYGKTFVVFDKDSFSDENFNGAVNMCNKNGYIPLWSNQAIEYWFLSHFNYIDVGMPRCDYIDKINKEFAKRGSEYKYEKNSTEICSKLNQFGSLKDAKRNCKRNHNQFLEKNTTPANSESCSTIYRFFDEIDKRSEEYEIYTTKDIFN